MIYVDGILRRVATGSNFLNQNAVFSDFVDEFAGRKDVGPLDCDGGSQAAIAEDEGHIS